MENYENVQVIADFDDVTPNEKTAYLNYVVKQLGDKAQALSKVIVTLADDGKNVDIDYVLDGQRFERIRRITGYLVGTIDRWNDAKQAELDDRVKHA